MRLTDDFPKSLPAEEYASARQRIQTGDILLCSGSGSFSKLIQGATNSAWSHVAFIRWDREIDRLMVMESVETIGVRTVPLSTYLGDYDSEGGAYPGGLVIIRHRDFPEGLDTLRDLGQFAADLLGYPYDNQEIAKIALRIAAASLLGFTDELERDREFICSEFVYECMNAVGVDIRSSGLGFIAPADYARDDRLELVAVLKGKT